MRLLAALLFAAPFLLPAPAWACQCSHPTGKLLVGDRVPEDIDGLEFVKDENAIDLDLPTFELQKQQNGGWVTMGSSTVGSLVIPDTPWVQGERWRVLMNSAEEAVFDIDPPLGMRTASLGIDVTLRDATTTFYECDRSLWSEVAAVSFVLPSDLQPYAELFQIEQFVDDHPWRFGQDSVTACWDLVPLTANNLARVPVPCHRQDEFDYGFEAGEHVLRYEARIAGSDVSFMPVSQKVTINCSTYDPNAPWPDAGSTGSDGSGGMGPGDAGPTGDAGCSATGSRSPIEGAVALLLFAGVFVARRRVLAT